LYTTAEHKPERRLLHWGALEIVLVLPSGVVEELPVARGARSG